ncbi:cation:proton antiporter [Azohydromonas lata]|uniref:cation:proton antiporter n=1 Tax=Azohydromonas lata TaxID=45677 RepID=UPI000835BF82|nr:cation:proton antiporter [Azohydromonas lata]
MPVLTQELAYIALIFGLMVVPRMLQRWNMPAPLSAFALGMLAAALMGGSSADGTLALLATLGISSLFLFAGLEVELSGLRRGLWPLLAHLAFHALALGAAVWLATRLVPLEWRSATLVALAVLTPSTGFILESLPRLGLDEYENFWVMNKAIGGELLALVVLFLTLQSESLGRLALSGAALLAMLAGLPLLFLALMRHVVPYARGCEFSLLVMVGVVAAWLTKQLGVYYLVGAFVAGLVARLLQERVPTLASPANLHAVRLFASFFVPFYFFYRGLHVPGGALQWEALGLGLLLASAALPLRVGWLWLQRRVMFREDARSSLRVALALSPTLIFTLVLAGILRERFGLPDAWYGALLVYAALSTLLPSLAFPLATWPLATPAATPAAGRQGA